MKTFCQTPAKIILSGEHAVLFGAPALSIALDLSTECTVEFTPKKDPDEIPFLEIELPDYEQKFAFPFSIWQKRLIDIESRFTLYEKNASSIQTVLQGAVDLLLVTLGQFNIRHSLKRGHWFIKINSHGLTERGLGSSASVVIALLKSLYLHHQIEPEEIDLLTLAQMIESRQHGSSSGIDTTTVYHGGLLRYKQGEPLSRLTSQSFTAWMIDTGRPQSTTGQAVSQVQKQFSHRDPIWKAFQKITEAIQQAWETSDGVALKKAVKENQALLEQIGVVPQAVQTFIKALNQHDHIAAKVCGSGAIIGDYAGMVLCLSQNAPTELVEKYGYSIHPVQFSSQGSVCELVV